tara:strand:+ start:20095 stop:22212 length:2118 start_codon:yes stop_codon:yes gene_type:complete
MKNNFLRKRGVVLAANMAFGALLAFPALAQNNYALVVAVSKYDNLDETLWLAGPVNDAKLVHEYLLDGAPIDFTEDRITLLADGIDGATAPTNAHIHEAFAALAEKAEPGDFVFLHFSGHGSQSPARVEGQEQDGLDELFLPSDISNWDMSTGTIPNALVDDDLGQMINRIIDKGANVWAVFDSCHSGTVTRAGPSGDPLDIEKSRKLGPATLGIPEDVMDAVEPVRTRSGSPAPEAATIETSGKGEGQFVYFYAAQTNQTTPEMRLPQGDPDRVSHGLFTFTLFEALSQNPALTYRQLGEEILRRYTAGYRVQPTPLFEGALDNPVFGADIGHGGRVQQWPVKQESGKRVFSGGRLHGLSVGDELSLLPGPAASDDEKMATIRVTSTDDFQSEFEIVDGGFVMIEPGFYARKAADEMSFGVTVAMPDPKTISDDQREAVQSVMEGLQAADREGLRLELVPAEDRADIYLQVANGSLWLVPAGAERIEEGTDKTISISYTTRDSSETVNILAESLARIARVANLLKLGDSFSSSDGGLNVTYYIQSAATGERTPVAPPAIPRLEPGDEMYLEAKNTSNRPLDLNILYVGVSYSIDFMYNGRINPGETLRDGLLEIIEGEYGRERLISIVTPAEPQTALADFSWLAQPAIGRTRAAGASRGGFQDMLAEAGFGEKTRAARRKTKDDDGSGIAQVALDILPPGSTAE